MSDENEKIIYVREPDPEPIDTGDDEATKERERKAALQRQREVEEMQKILSTEGGRMVINNILGMTQLFADPPWSAEYNTDRFVGMQDVGRKILAEIFTADRKAYILMQSEYDERLKQLGN